MNAKWVFCFGINGSLSSSCFLFWPIIVCIFLIAAFAKKSFSFALEQILFPSLILSYILKGFFIFSSILNLSDIFSMIFDTLIM